MPINTQEPITSAKLNTAIQELECPHLFCTEIGHSRKGSPLYALTLGRGARAVLINAAHHANEWITSLVAMKFLEERVRDFALAKPPKWAENVTLHIIPMVNPDGVDLVVNGQGSHDNWKANACGVDLNSNYPAGWEKARKHTFARGYNAPGPRDFVGPAPLSEPETCALSAYTIINDIDVTLSLHSQGEEIYWLYPGFSPPGAEALAHRFAAVSGYKLEDVPPESAFAGYRDWFIEKFNRPGFTIECGLGENPLPLSQFDEIYAKVSRILWEAIS
jgi:g-D-glutamyl-meso-diaminopimelate peptidase